MRFGTYTCVGPLGYSMILLLHVVLKQEAQRGLSETVNTAYFPQFSSRRVASRAVLRDLGLIEG